MVIDEVHDRPVPVRRSRQDMLCNAQVETRARAGTRHMQTALRRLRARLELTPCSAAHREGRTTAGSACLS